MSAPPESPPVVPVLVVGCGNLLRGDDAVGPLLVRHLWERGIPDGVELVDGGTAGMDVAFKMRGRRKVVIVDAARTGSTPGTLFRVPGEELENLPPVDGINQHAFRWDHALAVGRWLLKDGYPPEVVVFLVEAEGTEPGADLTPAVAAGMERAIELVLEEVRFRGENIVTVLSRPQPLGVLPLPAGWLVLPADALADEQGAEARRLLMAGLLPDPWPDGLRVVELAASGDAEAAAALVDPAAGPEHAYNHFVLTGEAASLGLARAGATGDLAALVTVAAYSLGQAAAADLPEVDGLAGEVAAHVLAARAAARLEVGDPQGALDALVAAEAAAQQASPVLAALLLGQQAGLLQEVNGADPDVVGAYVGAVDALRGMPAVELAMAELALGLGTAYQELAAEGSRPGEGSQQGQDLLVEAVRCYHLALRLLRKERRPERYAFAHSNLALCYLAMPMSDARDKLRRGVAVQSLREAAKIYTREEYPREWASVTLNLANALQHLPTTHPVENLVEAVGRYEELLEARPAQTDPVGHARVLANQGTALAHLGIHDQARPKLDAARELFAAAGDTGAVATVDAALADLEGIDRRDRSMTTTVDRAIVAGVPGVHEVQVVPAAPEPVLVPLASIGLRPGAATQDPR